jgi:NADPH2:quinone reductase
MKAVMMEAFGGQEVLQLKDAPIPEPLEHEVLIHIAYAAVNPVDWKIREGLLKSRLPHEFPLIPGWDASGTIAAVGKNVKNFQIGEEVYAYCRKPTVKDGTYAEYVTFDAAHVAQKPKNISFAQAAAFPLAALTAWQALFNTAHLQSGQSVLIHAGAGGVGGFAIQFAKHIGAKVWTTCSSINQAYVKKLGALHVIDYTKDSFAKQCATEFDVILDTIGGATLQESLALVKPGGHLVSIVEITPPEISAQHHIHISFIFVCPDGNQLEQIAKLVEQGKVQVPDIEEMDLADAAQAQEMSRSGHTRGKIVLKVS